MTDMDIAGVEGIEKIVSATNGVVITKDKSYVKIEDERGWHHRYMHLESIDTAIQEGGKVKMGQQVGLIGKKDGSGGFVHLHYDIKRKDPSPKIG